MVEAAPGHVEAVRGLVFDPLTKAQVRQLREITRRVLRAVDPGDGRLHGRPVSEPGGPPAS